DEYAIKAVELVQRPLCRIERLGVHARALQRGQHGVSALQRNFALGGMSAQQHCNLAKIPAHASTPITLTSCCNSIPCISPTVFRMCAISASISAAFASPRFTMKLACFSDTCAPPMR